MSKTDWQTLYLLIQTFILISESFVQGNFCTTDEDCTRGYRRFCCRNTQTSRTKRCGVNCIGQYCVTSDDCGLQTECCGIRNRCTTYGCASQCRTNADCNAETYCCRKHSITERSVCLPNCIGEFCRSDSDCGGKQECCSPLRHCTTYGCRHECLSNKNCPNNTFCCIKGHSFDKNSCRTTCLGESCQSDQDCGQLGLCCDADHLCSENCRREKARQLGGWIIATIVVTVGFVLLLTGLLAIFCVQRQRIKPAVENSVVVQLPHVKEPALPENSKPQNMYRRPPPLLPHENGNVQNVPLSPDKTLGLKKGPPVPPKLHKSCSPALKTPHKERRKPPPTPPKPNRNHTPDNDEQPPPRPPNLPPRRDQRAKNPDVGLNKERRPPPLPPGVKPRRCPPTLL